ncbi:NAD-dependent epimerase/dehydratase family protein [Bacillus sp. SCS-153A]|uniref:NAD-dependent epimerase/dehydratase family protein n=1 Tax=Rossellomorea sedimentorum TaxID=3115294 RepID=UPI003906246A
MKIAVTGGAGFIGSRLSQRLIAEGHKVYIIDSFHPYYPPERKERQLRNAEGFEEFHPIDLLDSEKTLTIIKRISPDTVIHMAALPGVAYSIEKPLKYVDYDIKATINVLEAAGKAGASHVIFASSSSVYGNQEGPSKEEQATGRVISPYAASKFSAESFCHVYEQLYGFRTTILRFFTVYGPWVRPDMAIGQFLKKLVNNEEITLYGEGRMRDFTYIDDIVEGIYLSLTKHNESEIFNLGNGIPVTMAALLEELKKFFPRMSVAREGEKAGDVLQTWADISKAERLLGYSPQVPFGKGLAETVKWALEHERYL